MSATPSLSTPKSGFSVGDSSSENAAVDATTSLSPSPVVESDPAISSSEEEEAGVSLNRNCCPPATPLSTVTSDAASSRRASSAASAWTIAAPEGSVQGGMKPSIFAGGLTGELADGLKVNGGGDVVAGENIHGFGDGELGEGCRPKSGFDCGIDGDELCIGFGAADEGLPVEAGATGKIDGAVTAAAGAGANADANILPGFKKELAAGCDGREKYNGGDADDS